VRFEPVAAGGQDREVTGLFSPHMDRRQCVQVTGFDRRCDALDDILVDQQAIGGYYNRASRHVLRCAPRSMIGQWLRNLGALERLHRLCGLFGLACRTRERTSDSHFDGFLWWL
jgi:hypothetical protein